MTSTNENAVCVNPINGDLCYTAGCFVIIYIPKENKQSQHFIVSRTNKPFQCLTLSKSGRFLAAGESAFKSPEICIYKLFYDQNEKVESVQAWKYLKGHKFGVEALRFSPDEKLLISLGDPNDKGLFVWDWAEQKSICKNKLSKPVLTLAISKGQDFLVTGGYQHLKYWYFNDDGTPQTVQTGRDSIMESKTADLEKVRVKIFVGIAIHDSKVYTVTSDGHVYIFDKQRKLLKWMNLKVDRAFSCQITEERLYCACSDGILRIFKTESLAHIVTLSRPPPLGETNILSGISKIKIASNTKSKFADILSVKIDEKFERVVALYSDRMMFIWDVKQLDKANVFRTFMSHNGPIHDVQQIPNTLSVGLNISVENCSDVVLDENLTKFVTCSSDRTIRFWHYIDPTVDSERHKQITKHLARNAYCKDMSKMIFVQENQGNNQQTPFKHFLAPQLDRNEDGSLILTREPSLFRDLTDAIRCVKISPDGKNLACGDWIGNIRIYDLSKPNEVEFVKLLEAHDNEVICLAFSPQLKDVGRFWLASGSRDKDIIVYDSKYQFESVCLLSQQHQSTITSLFFNKSSDESISLISGSADKSIIRKQVDQKHLNKSLEQLQQVDSAEIFKVNSQIATGNKVFSLDVAGNLMVSGHDNKLTLWQLPKMTKIWEQNFQEGEVQLRTYLDPTGTIVVSSSTSKHVTIYEAATGLPIAKCSNGEITTAMCLSENLKELITASDQGVIYIWRLPNMIADQMNKIKNSQIDKDFIFEDETNENDVLDVLKQVKNATNLINGISKPSSLPKEELSPKPLPKIQDQLKADIVDFYNKNQVVAQEEPEDDDDKLIMRSKKEVEYAQRFIGYGEQREQFEAALKQSTEAFKCGRKSIASLYHKKQAFLPGAQNKIDEVTDIVDDWNDIMAQPLGQSISKEQITKIASSSARQKWSANNTPSKLIEETKSGSYVEKKIDTRTTEAVKQNLVQEIVEVLVESGIESNKKSREIAQNSNLVEKKMNTKPIEVLVESSIIEKIQENKIETQEQQNIVNKKIDTRPTEVGKPAEVIKQADQVQKKLEIKQPDRKIEQKSAVKVVDALEDSIQNRQKSQSPKSNEQKQMFSKSSNNATGTQSEKKKVPKIEKLEEQKQVKPDESLVVMEDEDDLEQTLAQEIQSVKKSLANIVAQIERKKKSKKTLVKETTVDQLGESIDLWNQMMTGLGEKTNLNIEELSQKSLHIHEMQSSRAFSQLSSFSIKDDARDFLEKYSKMLVEEVKQSLKKQ